MMTAAIFCRARGPDHDRAAHCGLDGAHRGNLFVVLGEIDTLSMIPARMYPAPRLSPAGHSLLHSGREPDEHGGMTQRIFRLAQNMVGHIKAAWAM